MPFVHKMLEIPEKEPLPEIERILKYYIEKDRIPLINVDIYRKELWKEKLKDIFPYGSSLLLLHDYRDVIGGAEIYVTTLIEALEPERKVVRYSYEGKTTIWKRRVLFIVSAFAIWRGFEVGMLLLSRKLDAIWAHSVLRYIGFWGMFPIKIYSFFSPRKEFYISHHDIGIITPFPQDIYSEREIPTSFNFSDFVR
jgi:hypothetical protein